MLSHVTFQTLLPSLLLSTAVLLGLYATAWILRRSVARLAERLKARDGKSDEEVDAWAAQACAFVNRGATVIGVTSVTLIMLRSIRLRGIPDVSWDEIVEWLSGPGIRILLIVGVAYGILRFARLLSGRLPTLIPVRAAHAYEIAERRRRIETITNLLHNVAVVMVSTLTMLVVLREVGYDVTPILTGLGIGGLALGFGAQNLVRDVISGFFIIMENQIAVGDVAVINGKGGLVEAIRLRTIILRDLDGTVHIFPNGTITQLSNMTHEFSYYVIDLTVDYDEDLDRVTTILRQISSEMRKDPAFAADILADIEILGVDSFADAGLVLKVRIKTLPIRQWHVGRELRRRIQVAFGRERIEFPTRKFAVRMGEEPTFAVRILENMQREPSSGASRHAAR